MLAIVRLGFAVPLLTAAGLAPAASSASGRSPLDRHRADRVKTPGFLGDLGG